MALWNRSIALALVLFGLVPQSGNGQEPWGNLEISNLLLDPDPQKIQWSRTPSNYTTWHFNTPDSARVREILNRCTMPPHFINDVLATAALSPAGNIQLFPTSKIIRDITSECRMLIYKNLRASKKNIWHTHPVLFEYADTEKWFTGLSTKNAETVKELIYPANGIKAFSDLPVLIGQTTTHSERMQILKAINKNHTLVVKLQFTSQTNGEKLKNYWSMDGRSSPGISLLDSIIREGTPRKFDIALLLPPIPRRHLYQFPTESMGVNGVFPDSLWMALNFFQYEPIEIPIESRDVDAHIHDNYSKVDGPYQYGDVLIMRSSTGEPFRNAAVYIAKDIVYTKKNRSILTPFVLKKMDRWKSIHTIVDSNITIEAWRLKPI